MPDKPNTIKQDFVANLYFNDTEAQRSLEQLEGTFQGILDLMDKISSGRDFNKYWNTQRSSIEGVANAYRRFKESVSYPLNIRTGLAEDLIKSTNAFLASGNDASELYDKIAWNFDDILKSAKSLSVETAEAFNVAELREAFELMQMLSDKGVDLSDIFKTLNVGASESGLRAEVEGLNNELAKTTAKLRETQAELDEVSSGSGVSRLKEQIEDLKDEVDSFRSNAEVEFYNFLEGNNIDPNQRFLEDYFDSIKTGIYTSADAIRDFKREYGYLLRDANAASGSVTSMMSMDTSGIEDFRDVVESARDSISSMIEALGSSGISGAAQPQPSVVSGVTANLNELVQQFREIADTSPEARSAISGILSSITELVSAFTSLGSLGSESVDSVEILIRQISRLDDINIEKSSMANLINAISDLANMSRDGSPSLSWVSNLDLSKFNNLKVTKSTATNIVTLLDGLTKASGINVDALDKVTKLNFDNLKGLKFDKESLSGLADLANVTDKVQALQKIVEETTGKSVEATARDIEASKKPLGDPDMIETYRNKVIQLNQAITTAHDNLRRWTAGDESYKAYEGQVKQLESLYDRLKDLTRSQYDSQYKAIQEQMSESIKDMAVSDTRQKVLTADTKEYVDAMLNLERIKSTVSGDDNYTGMILSLSAKLKTEKMTVKEFSEELSKLKLSIAEGKNTGGIGEKLLGDDLDTYSKKTKEIISLIISAKANLDKWSAASTGASKGSFEQYAKDIESLRALVDVMDGFSAKNVSEQVSVITADMKECELAIRDAGEAMQLPAVIDVGSEQYKSSIAEIARLQQQIAINATKWSAAESGASKEAYDNYVAQGVALDAVNKALQTGVLEVEDYKAAVRDIKAAMDEAAGAIKIAGENKPALPLVSKDDPATVKEYYNNLEKTDNLIKQITQNVNKWTAAEEGQSRKAFSSYKNLINDLEELQEKVKSGTITQEEFNTEFSRIKSSAAEASRSIAAVGENTSKFGSLMDRAADAAQRFIITYLSIRDLIRYASQMVRTSMEIESAMTRIQIITGSTDRQMQSFFEVASSNAKDLGKSIQDVASSIETFTRLGYNMNDASILSKYATIMSNVADTTTDAATTGLTSIIKGYGLDVSDVEHVTDVLVQVGQKYAISAEELMEAFERGGAALAASGTSFEQSAALFAATNAALQNANITGTMWKTVSARIRSAKTELEELGESTDDLAEGFSKYREELKALSGVDIMADEDHYKDLLTIFTEIAAVWDDIRSDESRARIAEILGGTRQLSGIMSTITNISDAINAYEDATNSAGVAIEANNLYMEDSNAHLEQLKTSFGELSSDVFSSGLIKFVIDSIRAIIELVDLLIDSIGTLGTVAVGVGAFTNIKKLLASLDINSLKDIGVAITKMVEGVRASISASESAIASSIGVTVSGLGMMAAGAAAAVVAVIALYDLLTESSEEANNAMRDAVQEYDKAKSKLDSLTAEARTYGARIDELLAKDSLTPIEQAELDRLIETNNQLQVQIGLQEKLLSVENKKKADAAINAYNKNFGENEFSEDLVDSYYNNLKETLSLDNASSTGKVTNTDSVAAELGALKRFTELRNEALQKMQEAQEANNKEEDEFWSGEWEYYNKVVTETEESILTQSELLLEYRDILASLPENELAQVSGGTEMLEQLNSQLGYIYKTLDPSKWSRLNSSGDAISSIGEGAKGATETADALQDVAESAEDAQERIDSLVSALSEIESIATGISNGKSLSIEDWNSENLKDYRSALEYVNGTMQLNLEKVREIADAKAKEEIATQRLNKANKQADYIENAREIERLENVYANLGNTHSASATKILDSISALRAENTQILETCDGYDVLIYQLESATSAYSHWLNAQNAADYGDMYNDAESAIKRIMDTYDSSSDIGGDFGSRKFAAAVDFIVPESVDKEDADAIKAYMDDLNKYFLFDEDGNNVGMNIEKFCQDSVEKGLMVFDEASGEYRVAGNTMMEDFAEGLNLSSGLVQAFFDELQLKGGKFNWADEAIKTIGDLAVEAYQARDAIVELGDFSDNIVIDVTGIDGTEEKLNALDNTIAQMTEYKNTIDLDPSQIEYANTVIQYCVAQKNELLRPDIMRVDTSQVEGAIGEAIAKLQEFQQARDNLETLKTIGADTSTIDAAQQKVEAIAEDLRTMPTAMISLGVNTESTDTISASIDQISANHLIKLGVDTSAIDEYDPEGKECTVHYDPDTSDLPESFGIINRTVKYIEDTSGLRSVLPEAVRMVRYVATGGISGSNYMNGTAHARGTAMASGDWGTAPGGKTLLGELGREIVVDPLTGRWYTVGENGAEFVNIPRGAIVFNHEQTEDLLAHGYVGGRASALVSGTAMVTGGIRTNIGGSAWRRVSKSSGSSSSRSGGSRSYGGGSSSSSGNHSSSSSSSSSSSGDSSEPQVIDWIEVAISRIERAIENLNRTATSTFKTLATRLAASDKEITSIITEIDIQQRGAQRYLQEANSVGLSPALAERVRNGTIDINEYDEATAKLIQEYQSWYEKSIACSDAVEQLHEDLAALYEDKFNTTQNDFENQLSLLEHLTTSFNNGLDYLEERGYFASTKYYQALQNVEKDNINVMKRELDALIARMSEAVNSGEIKEGSESWYNMQQEINGVKEAIQESETELVKLSNSIRELRWERFEYLQDLISNITDESDFLIKLMSSSDLFTDNGQLTSYGLSTMGLHGQNYNVYMNQADRYAEKIKQINAELANDPNNTKLIDQREEWLKQQRQSILNAEDEKESIVSLVEEGIQKELDSLKSLIDAYNESADSAKDLYDYQKKVKKQADEVSSLQKQLSAYSGDNSEEARSTIQKLNTQLREAMANLEETESDRALSEQKKMLDNLYNEYESVLNQRLDNVDILISDMIDRINDNSGTIADTITAEADSVGYLMSENLSAMWANEGPAGSIITRYGDLFSSELTSVNSVLNSIALYVSGIAGQSNSIAKTDIASTTKSTATNKSVKAQKVGSTSTAKNANAKTNVGIVTPNLGKASDRLNVRQSPTTNSAVIRQLANGNLVETDWKEQDGWLHIRIHNAHEDYWGWVYKQHIKAYAKGARHIGRSGDAWTQEYGTEAILRPTENAMLTRLRAGDTVLNAGATDNIFDFGNNPKEFLANLGFDSANNALKLRDILGSRGIDVGGISINIPIDHVENYDDFMNKMTTDGRFEKFIQSMTVDRLAGGSKFSKRTFRW